MSREQFFKWLDEQPIDDKLVRIRYKYSIDKEWTYSNEVLEFCDSDYVWLSDWWEGQEEVEILGCIALEDVTVPRFEGESA